MISQEIISNYKWSFHSLQTKASDKFKNLFLLNFLIKKKKWNVINTNIAKVAQTTQE